MKKVLSLLVISLFLVGCQTTQLGDPEREAVCALYDFTSYSRNDTEDTKYLVSRNYKLMRDFCNE